MKDKDPALKGLPMLGSSILAIFVFGAMFVACTIGLSTFNTQSKRLNATASRPGRPAAGREAAPQYFASPRR
ncbi:MAG: hypothetical protein ACK4L4_11925 [Gemmobacter sp.]